jgi:hypothetical protein
MQEPIRAEHKTVIFFDGLQVEGYRMPSGEFRVGLAGASRVLGYSDNWLNNVLKRSARTAKELRGLGFTDEIQKVIAQSVQGNLLDDSTIGLRDFSRLIAYSTFKGKKAALALQLSLTELSLVDFFRDAFGEPPLSIDEKRRLFYETYAASISPEDWRRMDREEIIRLALLGDEPQLRDGLWNQ